MNELERLEQQLIEAKTLEEKLEIKDKIRQMFSSTVVTFTPDEGCENCSA